jgi:hypothetical protein
VTDDKLNKQNLRRLKKVKTWQLVSILLLMGFIAATFLRLNNIGMTQRFDAVKAADKVGDNQIIQDRLYDLQRFISDHMNTNMSNGIYLEDSYQRDYKKAYNVASLDGNPNGNIYKKVQDVCAPQFSGWSTAYVQCVTDELAKYPSANSLAESVKLPKAELYHYSFASPVWSADFAGWSILICIILTIMIVVRLIFVAILKWLIHRHKMI